MRTLEQAIAGNLWDMAVFGSYFRLLKTSQPVDVRLYRNGQMVSEAIAVDQGYFVKMADNFDRASITTPLPQTVKIAVSDGTGGYDRLTVDIASNASQASSVSNAAPVTVGVAATLIVAGDATRKGLRIYNAGSADVWIGGAGITTANGCIKIGPGESLIENEAPAAAWWGISATAGQELRVQVLA